MPFIQRQQIPPDIRAQGERTYKEALLKRLQDPFLDPTVRAHLKQEMARITNPTVGSLLRTHAGIQAPSEE
jgi:hypothetical protein